MLLFFAAESPLSGFAEWGTLRVADYPNAESPTFGRETLRRSKFCITRYYFRQHSGCVNDVTILPNCVMLITMNAPTFTCRSSYLFAVLQNF